MYQLKSLAIANNCFALIKSDIIKFGVRIPATKNAKLWATIQEEVNSILKLGEENKATEEEINAQLLILDNKFLGQFETIDYNLTKEHGKEIITGIYMVIDGKETHVPTPIQAILEFLYEHNIIR